MTSSPRLIDRRIHGVRVMEAAAFIALLLSILFVYLAKAGAARQGAAMVAADQEIARERRAIRALEAETAHLEQPQRIGALSRAYLELEPLTAARETDPDSLRDLAEPKAREMAAPAAEAPR